MDGSYPPQQFWPQVPPRRRTGRVVALVTAAVLGGGLIGGTTGAVIAGTDSPLSPAPVTATAAADTAPADVSAVVAKVMPSVVEINVRTGAAEGVGSGVILTADGRILTNHHVVAGAREIRITFADGTTAPATVVGTDRASDLAVLQATGVSDLTPAALGDSDTVRVGDSVIAIGSPAGLQGTVTTGIISALDRDVTIASGGVSYAALQTDASINQGNSGGPLFDADGRVIGVNSAIYSPTSGPGGSAGSVGIGFSIPINTAKAVIERMG
ncbi:S1C family serine protease [Actinokineospora sp. UTMC 2448]|uniref:S1C family serine protease n=1 Tax=Actinokineospora sp. UTMC 2448 TaxID=2268449 RepID=UPI00216446C7|nr:trypsin-like peptidase domain-containing protein [Actinokineospora sp. UTMC 2448]UVS78070.1 Periplasmic pH-dependent serine endoprotease DegQ precursor [Actinokineospora sp. UTMC 2448]